jgi:hypothetical protein
MTTEMFIRFGDLPQAGRSWNADLSGYEAGISVYRAEWQSSDHDVICVEIPQGAQTGTIDQVADRPVYVITGDLLNRRGGDGEPLMTNCHAELVGPVEIVNYVISDE